jgi:hypothetical protein
MRRLIAALTLASGLWGQAAAGDAPPFAPALYSLRATDKQGSSLILLSKDGKETLIEADARKAVNPGLLSNFAFATHFGFLSLAPDGDQVLYARFDNATTTSTEGDLGSRRLEGIYTWGKGDPKPRLLWDRASFKKALKPWFSTPLGKQFKDFGYIDFVDDIECNSPHYVFHLGGKRFAWVLHHAVLEIDLAASTLRPLYVCLPVESFEVRAHLDPFPGFLAWQDTKRCIHLFRPGRIAQIHADGSVSEQTLGNSRGIAFLDDQHFILAQNGDLATEEEIRDGQPWSKKTFEVKGSEFQGPTRDQKGYYALVSHGPFQNQSRLERHGLDGTLQWTLDLGPFHSEGGHNGPAVWSKDLCLLEEGSRGLQLVFRPTDSPRTRRLTIDPERGSILEDREWGDSRSPLSSKFHPLTALGEGLAAPVDLPRRACLIRQTQGWMVWMPAHGVIKETPGKAGWSRPSGPSTLVSSVEDPSVSYGAWMWMDEGLVLHPLWTHPLADQMVITVQDQSLAIPTWVNQGLEFTETHAAAVMATGPAGATSGSHLTSSTFPFHFPVWALRYSDSLQTLDHVLLPADPKPLGAAR